MKKAALLEDLYWLLQTAQLLMIDEIIPKEQLERMAEITKDYENKIP